MISYLEVQDVAVTDQEAPGADDIQPELALSRPGLKTYLWQICGAQILIEVSDTDQIKVNGEPVVPSARRP